MRAAIALLLCSAGCTLATDAGERQVDARLGRDLQYTFKSFEAHAGTPLDAVLVETIQPPPSSGKLLRLTAHARIRLPAVKDGQPYPDQLLALSNVFPSAPATLLFYSDSNDDNLIQGGITSGTADGEHIWREPVAPTGIGEFTHRFAFREFTKDEYAIGFPSVVLSVAAPVPDWRPAPCPSGRDHVLEVRIKLGPSGGEQSDIGYYRDFSSNPLPSKPIVIDNIIDSGSFYTFEISVDGTIVHRFGVPAPDTGNLEIPQADWLRAAGEDTVSVCD